jgi:hypothetical protein
MVSDVSRYLIVFICSFRIARQLDPGYIGIGIFQNVKNSSLTNMASQHERLQSLSAPLG